jgi:tetratricopeptide (TPR) repeat protein
MLVTLPFLLLLLDHWPLRRFQKSQVRRLVVEKLPFIALSAASCVVTVFAQRKGGAVVPLTVLSVEGRIANAIVSYPRYIWKLLWPHNMAIVYPYEEEWPFEATLLASVLLLAVSLIVFLQRRQRGYLLTGWLWFVGTLVPVIGLVQVGNQSMADRYTYLPGVGLFIIAAWGLGEVFQRSKGWVPATAAAAVLFLLALISQAQIAYWQNSETVFRHALAVTKNNFIAYNGLGFYYTDLGELEKGKENYLQTLRLNPAFSFAWHNLAVVYAAQKKYDEAITNYETALRINPRLVGSHDNLADLLARQGHTNEAIDHYIAALQIEPGNATAHQNLASLLAANGKLDEAEAHCMQATRSEPRNPGVYLAYGQVLVKAGKLDQAIAAYKTAQKLDPKFTSATYSLGQAYAQQGDAARAFAAFSKVLQLKADDPDAHYELAQVLSKQGNIREAVKHYRLGLKSHEDVPEALNNLAWILAANSDPQVRDGPQAVKLAEHACELTQYKKAIMIGTLAAAYAEAGRFPDAVAAAEKAKAQAEKENQPDLVAKNTELLETYYRASKPYHESP